MASAAGAVAQHVVSTSTPRARPRLGKKEKQQLKHSAAAETAAAVAHYDEPAPVQPLKFFSLSEQGSSRASNLPVVFSHDSLYAFVATGPLVKVYATDSVELLSTIAAPSSTPRSPVSALLLNPANPLQLLVGALDGTLRVWDYTDGKLLRTLDLGSAVLHACGHRSLPDMLFVALRAATAVAENDERKTGPGAKRSRQNGRRASSASSTEEHQKAGIYSISLRAKVLADSDANVDSSSDPAVARTPARRMRLAQPRIVKSLALSPSGRYLVSLNPNKINVCRTDAVQRGFAMTVDSEGDQLTTLAFHPTENYFATGDTRGRIRLWYDVLRDDSAEEEGKIFDDRPVAARPATAVFHWHAHAVSSLAFTPNGAYLLSGGQEAVLVLWQLHTGHQEYVPRLGAPILSLSIMDNGLKEQQVAARLQDGSVVFVGGQKLKISKTISGLKADAVQGTNANLRSRSQVPLALQPNTSSLVLSAGHPSSIQFYSPAEDTQKMEIEVSPSNRVSSAGSRPIEPTRVELVAFSKPSQAGGAYWMATHDSWENGTFNPSRHLKFWQSKGHGNTFSLTTRIDRPHDSRITSIAFSPSTSPSAPPLLLTTSTDGRCKLWALDMSTSTWSCRTSLSYRGFTPRDSAWAHDGSMFAVAHDHNVTLWSLADLRLIHAFPCAGIAPTRSVEFVNEEGTALLAGGQHGTVVWDLLTFEETFNLAFEVGSITPKPNSSSFVALEKPRRRDRSSSAAPSSSTAFIVTAPSTFASTSAQASCSSRQLPFPVRQSLWLPSSTSSLASASTDPAEDPSSADAISLAVVDDRGAVSLVGAAATVGAAIAPSRLPTASGRRSDGQSRLFDEIFGSEARDIKRPKSASSATALRNKRSSTAAATTPQLLSSSSSSDRKGKGTSLSDGSLEMLIDTPAHTLPPARLLWREMLGAFQQPHSSVSSLLDGENTSLSRSAMGEISASDRLEDPLQRTAADSAGDEEDVTSERSPRYIYDVQNAMYSASPADVLSEIFKTRCSVGTPKLKEKSLTKSPASAKAGKKLA